MGNGGYAGSLKHSGTDMDADAGFLSERILRAELGRSFTRLSFAPELEALFRRDNERQATFVRRNLLFASVGLVGITPLYDSAVLGLPDRFNSLAHAVQFGLMIPALLLALASTYMTILRRHSAGLTILALICVAGGLLAQRVLANQLGVTFPLDFVTAAVSGCLLMAGLRFKQVLPYAWLVMLCATGAEMVQIRHHADAIYNIICMWMLSGVVAGGAYYIESLRRSAWLQQHLLELQAFTDPLTGLSNRRQFMPQAARLLAQAARGKRGVALCMIDVDNFKAYNDRYGHSAGDECLKRIGKAIQTAGRRPLDLSVRWGGEEFAVLWYNIDLAMAETMAERIRKAVADLNIEHAGSSAAKVVTVSAGVWHEVPRPSGGIDDLLVRADGLLYTAKGAGRNCVVARACAPSMPRPELRLTSV